MEKITDTLNKKTIDHYSVNKSKSYSYYRGEISNEKAEFIIEQAVDLISDANFRPFFFKTLYMIGPANFYECMDIARKLPDLKCRPCFFVKRLKHYRDQVQKT